LRSAVHDRDIAHVALERRQLHQNVLGVLAGQSRKGVAAERVSSMAGGAGWDAIR
jgi:hypothetical protein